MRTARNNLSPDTAAPPEITYVRFVLRGRKSDFFRQHFHTKNNQKNENQNILARMKRIPRFCNHHTKKKSHTDSGVTEQFPPPKQNITLQNGPKSEKSWVRESASRARRATAAPAAWRAHPLIPYITFRADVGAKRAISRPGHPDWCPARGERVVGSRIDGAAKNRRAISGFPDAGSWVIVLADNCAGRCGHRRRRKRSST